jgi:hypothetical protein
MTSWDASRLKNLLRSADHYLQKESDTAEEFGGDLIDAKAMLHSIEQAERDLKACKRILKGEVLRLRYRKPNSGDSR